MSTKPELKRGDKWAMAFLAAMGMRVDRCARLIIDCEVGRPMRVHVSYFGDERVWDVQMPTLDIVEVVPKKGSTEPSDVTEMGARFREVLP